MQILIHNLSKVLRFWVLTNIFFACENAKPSDTKPENIDNHDFVAPKSISKNNNLTQGTVAYNVPDTMTLKKKQRIELRISRDKNILNIRRNLNGTVTTQRIKVGKVMEARLIGDKFKIESLSSGTQWINKRAYTIWEWNVTPLEFGSHDLHLKIIAKKNNYNQDYPVLDKKIYVYTNNTGLIQHFWEENWQWVLSAIVFPIIAWLLVRTFFRKPPKKRAKKKRR